MVFLAKRLLSESCITYVNISQFVGFFSGYSGFFSKGVLTKYVHPVGCSSAFTRGNIKLLLKKFSLTNILLACAIYFLCNCETTRCFMLDDISIKLRPSLPVVS